MIDQFIAAFILGLLGSVHCIGMCGPISLLLNTNSKNEIKDRLFYNLGRTVTYTMLGFFTGLFGLGLHLAGMQNLISIFSGILLIFFLLSPHIWKRFESKIYSFSLITKLKNLIYKIANQRQFLKSGFTLGILNGFLPCGMVYIAITASLQVGSVIGSAAFLSFFGFGTIPLMLLSSILTPRLLNKFKLLNQLKVSLTVCLALIFILRGLNLGIPFISPKTLNQTKEMNQHH